MSAEPASYVEYDENFWEDIYRIIEETEYVSRKHAPKAFVEIELRAVTAVTEQLEVFDIITVGALPNFDSAVCATVDPEIFFPERGKTSNVKRAKKLCLQCVHATDCREYAMRERIQYGIWGGMTYSDRKRLMRMMGIEDGEEG